MPISPVTTTTTVTTTDAVRVQIYGSCWCAHVITLPLSDSLPRQNGVKTTTTTKTTTSDVEEAVPSDMAVASAFFEACESGRGCASCSQYVSASATFGVQAMDSVSHCCYELVCI